MMKCLLTLIAATAMTPAFAASDKGPNTNDSRRNAPMMRVGNQSLTVSFTDQGKSSFQLAVKTVAEMPTAADLEISSVQVIAPTGRIPGTLALTLRPAGDAQIQMVGQQQGTFSFPRGTLPQGLPDGRYMLTINGEVYGMLLLTPDKALLRQLKQNGNVNDTGAATEPAPAAATAQ